VTSRPDNGRWGCVEKVARSQYTLISIFRMWRRTFVTDYGPDFFFFIFGRVDPISVLHTKVVHVTLRSVRTFVHTNSARYSRHPYSQNDLKNHPDLFEGLLIQLYRLNRVRCMKKSVFRYTNFQKSMWPFLLFVGCRCPPLYPMQKVRTANTRTTASKISVRFLLLLWTSGHGLLMTCERKVWVRNHRC
jgi:hypothetical protein